MVTFGGTLLVSPGGTPRESPVLLGVYQRGNRGIYHEVVLWEYSEGGPP